MTDIGIPTEDGMAVTPPLMNPSSPNYEKLNMDIPLEQPLIFYLDNSKAYYLPHEQTDDESVHSPQGVVNTLTKERIFQQVNIRQGQSDMQNINCLFVNQSGPIDMTDTIIRFAGNDAGSSEISDDESFSRTQASLGRLTWRPSAVVSQTAGRFKTAHFVIENVDRTKVLATLDFSLNIIANDVAYPRALAFYMSEYQRSLFHIGEMQKVADKQLNYLLNFESAVVSDTLEQIRNQIKLEIDDVNSQLDSAKKTVDDYISKSKTKLDTLNGDIDTAQTRMDKLETQINSDDLVTKGNILGSMQLALDSGQLTINTDDLILDHDVSVRIDELNQYITESEGGTV
ncbi:BppU family phage baseplate upper protein [Companilactobacillus muriivasis]|uniref:BppU family phage baseplate upper protein n=1 Tax=Companilactobacillus muriivasis TaxID=3081444 RepID=UPI0030C78088